MESVSTRKRRIAALAKKHQHAPLTALNHHLDLNWLAEAYGSLRTRLIKFPEPPKGDDGPKPETFDFLGFTHYWGKSRKGNYVVKKKTASKRFRRTLRSIKEWGWKNRHIPLKIQHEKLDQKLKGHDAYYGVIGNSRMLSRLRHEVARQWRRWLGRRNRGGRRPSWEKFQGILKTFPLAPARVIHSTVANPYT